jgi:hypothetical protein
MLDQIPIDMFFDVLRVNLEPSQGRSKLMIIRVCYEFSIRLDNSYDYKESNSAD